MAVSGGADSLCLALLASAWTRVLALIVDHGLRAESAGEAAATRTRLERMRIESRILTLRGLVTGPGMASRARTARYAALASACRDEGLVDLLLGHHRLDQAETVLMRRASGSGGHGLAAMPRIRNTGSLRLIRPLLDVPPGRLRETLRRAGLDWVEDPSNRDRSATRVRLRGDLGDPDGDGGEVDGLARLADEAGQRRAADETDIADELASGATIRPEGCVLLAPRPWSPPALAAVLRAVAGAEYPVSADRVAGLAASLRPSTCAGCRIVPGGRFGPGWLVVREWVAAAIPAHDGAVWDGRFRLRTSGLPADTELGALGAEAAGLRHLSDLPSAALRVLPALRRRGTLVAVPHLGYHGILDSGRAEILFSPPVPVAGSAFAFGRRRGRGCTGATRIPSDVGGREPESRGGTSTSRRVAAAYRTDGS